MPTSSPDPASTPFREIYTVSRLNLEARRVIESAFQTLWVEGELSNLARPRSGHMYFSLKDAQCQVRCAMFRMNNRHLGFEPRDGMQVLAQAKAGLYPERGEFQLVVQYMEEAGDGALRRAFDALKQRLQGEGLFEADRKRPLPGSPARIGVVTSPTGAALRDVLSVLARRAPGIPVLVYPVPVQGTGAGREIARMIDLASERAECDVLILTRGGGSLEDLWAFNEEAVARAIARCAIPLVSGVGHEIDFTIADFVADQRAPTPSAAAELVSPDTAEWRAWLIEAEQRLLRGITRRTGAHRTRLDWLRRRLVHPSRRLSDLAQRLDGLAARLQRAAVQAGLARRSRLAAATARLHRHEPGRLVAAHRLHCAQLRARLRRAATGVLRDRRARLDGVTRAMEAVSPLQTLERGYAIVLRRGETSVVTDAASLEPGAAIEARLARGTFTATVDGVERGEEEP